MRTVTLVSDTHGLLRPSVLPWLREADLVLHAGDVGDDRTLAALRAANPETICVRGNVDRSGAVAALPATEAVTRWGRSFYVLHDIATLDLEPAGLFDVVVSGHSHQPSRQLHDGVLYVNPGSIGPRRFRLPISLAVLRVDEGAIGVEFVELAA